LLDGLGINPLNKGNAVGAAFTSFATALGNPAAAAEAARSATDYLAFQCVGFDVVVSMMTGGGGEFSHAKLLDTIEPAGYDFVAGVGSCAPGDFFVDKMGTGVIQDYLLVLRVPILFVLMPIVMVWAPSATKPLVAGPLVVLLDASKPTKLKLL
jgi:hypothetical protein